MSLAVTAQGNASMGSRMLYSRLIGALFLAGFLVYGVGFGLVTSVIGTPDTAVKPRDLSAGKCTVNVAPRPGPSPW